MKRIVYLIIALMLVFNSAFTVSADNRKFITLIDEKSIEDTTILTRSFNATVLESYVSGSGYCVGGVDFNAQTSSWSGGATLTIKMHKYTNGRWKEIPKIYTLHMDKFDLVGQYFGLYDKDASPGEVYRYRLEITASGEEIKLMGVRAQVY